VQARLGNQAGPFLSPAFMEETFMQNREYIDRLIRNAFLTKANKQGSEYTINKKHLLQFELKLTSKEVIQNTKLAFNN
jgi:hypothetical protein